MNVAERIHANEGAGLGVILPGVEVCELKYRTLWICEKYEQDKVDFVLAELGRRGAERIPHHVGGRTIWRPFEDGAPSDLLHEFDIAPDAIEERPGNLLLNEGLQRMLDLLIAAGGTAYNNANAFIGVGDSSTAEAATQTDLQAATNHFYKGMNVSQPSRTNQTITWASDFTSTEANYVWSEWTVSAGATGVSGAGFTTGTTNLNRKVQALGTKATGTWTLTVTITFT